ncbi:AMP-binding protein [Alcaligenaceae bacterium]|nr:AMP-binding protein [Alcaligenaceae bacterium]
MRLHGIAGYEALQQRANTDPEWWWNAIADLIEFTKPYDKLLDIERGLPFARWCVGGKTNIVLNSLDRHRGTPIWQTPAILGEAESGKLRTWTYQQLSAEVSRLAAGLDQLGIKEGEVVAVFMPNVNEAIAGLLAIAKIGAVVMPLFSGFGVEAIVSRMLDSEAVAILTVDATSRRGRLAPMKTLAIEASRRLPSLRHIICLKQSDVEVPPSRLDVDWAGLCAGKPCDFPTKEMDAESPVMLLYTSGTTGKPKGTVHDHAGLAAKFSLDISLFMDIRPGDRAVWPSDMGWLVGPLLAFGFTMVGASFVLSDGAPNYPDPGRMWRQVESYGATVLGLAPTVIRGFMNDIGTGGHDTSKIRLCISTGEAWTPDAWWWTFEHVLHKKSPILNYSGGTEIGGGILSGSVVCPMKPCAFSGPIPGMGVDIVDAEGNSLPDNTVGELVLRKMSIGLTRGLWNDPERYLDSYWRDIPGVWRQGDWAVRDSDGFWYVLGRSDDTLKIAGKRTGPSEVEGLLTATGKVLEVAAIGIPDRVKGEAVACVVVLGNGVIFNEGLNNELQSAIVEGLGYPYKPLFILPVQDLPKTRNMKVMRRLVKAACLGKPLGDTSSLVNPDALQGISEASLQVRQLIDA